MTTPFQTPFDEFPINRCHQRVVTSYIPPGEDDGQWEFPINRCHQRVVTENFRTQASHDCRVSNQ